jgi:hypothetical protein
VWQCCCRVQTLFCLNVRWIYIWGNDSYRHNVFRRIWEKVAAYVVSKAFSSHRKKKEKTVSSIDQCLRNDGQEFSYAETGQRTDGALQLKDILVSAVGNPAARTRRNATAVQVTPSTFWKALREQFLYPSHQFRMQYLQPQAYIWESRNVSCSCSNALKIRDCCSSFSSQIYCRHHEYPRLTAADGCQFISIFPSGRKQWFSISLSVAITLDTILVSPDAFLAQANVQYVIDDPTE